MEWKGWYRFFTVVRLEMQNIIIFWLAINYSWWVFVLNLYQISPKSVHPMPGIPRHRQREVTIAHTNSIYTISQSICTIHVESANAFSRAYFARTLSSHHPRSRCRRRRRRRPKCAWICLVSGMLVCCYTRFSASRMPPDTGSGCECWSRAAHRSIHFRSVHRILSACICIVHNMWHYAHSTAGRCNATRASSAMLTKAVLMFAFNGGSMMMR